MARTSEPWTTNSTIRVVLTYTRYLTPLLLLTVFSAVFVARSILEARRAPPPLRGQSKHAGQKSKGPSRAISPGSKGPLNKSLLDFGSGKKVFFIVANFLLLLTFVGNIVIVLTHAVSESQDGYWCEQAYVVGLDSAENTLSAKPTNSTQDLPRGDLFRLLPSLHFTRRNKTVTNKPPCYHLDSQSCLGNHSFSRLLFYLLYGSS